MLSIKNVDDYKGSGRPKTVWIACRKLIQIWQLIEQGHVDDVSQW